jgi:hypothetical protein
MRVWARISRGRWAAALTQERAPLWLRPRSERLSMDRPVLAWDEEGAPSPAVGSVLLATQAQAPTCVSRRQSRSAAPPGPVSLLARSRSPASIASRFRLRADLRTILVVGMAPSG